MARPRLGESETERLHVKISADEITSIEDWRYANRIPSRSEAVRRLCQIGLSWDRDGKVLLKRAQRALKATIMIMERVSKADIENMPKGIRGGLAVVLEEQSAATKAALATLVAAGVYSDSADLSEFKELIKRAEDYVETLVEKNEKLNIGGYLP